MAGNRQYDHEYKVQAENLITNSLKKSDKLRQLKNWECQGIPCMAGYMRTVLTILILELAHRLHKVP